MVTVAKPSPAVVSPPQITPIECTGSPYDLGVAQGRACQDQLRTMHETIIELLGMPQGRLRGAIARPLVRAAGQLGRLAMQRDMEQHYPAQAERIRGIAAGADLSLADLYVGPAVELILNKVSYVTPGACTAVAIASGRSSSGEAVIAKNFDYPAAAAATYAARISRPSTAAASIDVTAAPMPGSHEGVNEHGLAVAYNYGHFSGTPAARVPITILVQELLETCKTVDDAIKRVRARPRTGGAILMLADASGAAASVEVAPDHIGVRMASDHDNWLAHANHAVTDAMLPRDIPHDAILSKWYPKTMRGLRVQESSMHRHARAEQMMSDAGTMTEQQLIDVISDHAGGSGDDTTICRHGPFYATTCSVVLFPKRRTMKLMFGIPCQDAFTELSL